VNRLLYLLFALGGVSGLVYAVIWMRSFRVVFGSSTRSAAVVLAAFFGGVALGSLLGARLARRDRPLRLYGWAEIGVGLSALLVAPWLWVFGALYPALWSALAERGPLLGAAKLALAFAALAPPTLAMGVTLPLVSRAAVTRADHVARRTGLLYALNVAGATAGALLAAFVLPPAVGVRNSVYLAVALNLAIGAVALRLREPAGLPPLAPTPTSTLAPRRRERPAPALLFAAALSGFGTLALEVLFVRILNQHSEGSVYTFGLMLVTFLLFLAVGAGLVARWLDEREPWRFLAWTQLGAVAAILLSPLLFQLVPFLTLYSERDTLSLRLFRFGLGSLLVLGPSVCLVGVVLPSTWKLAARDASNVGSRIGTLTAYNTLGGVAGSLAAAFLLLPWLGLGRSVVLVAALYALLALFAFGRAYTGAARWAGRAATVALLLAGSVLGVWRGRLQPLEAGDRLLRYSDGESATVAVVERRNRQRALMLNHTYLLGASGAADREVRQGRLPLLLHPRPERVAFVGVATGLTASAVLDFPVERAVAIELVPGVVDALPAFAPWNRDFFRDARVEVVTEDGRDYLRGTRERFDVIVSDLFVPWHAGTGDLYSVEHFAAVSRRLAPGGLFAQWLPGYQLTPEELRTIAASFLSVFPSAALWRNDFHPEQPLLALVGYRDGESLDPAALRADCARLARVRRPAAPFLSSPEGVAMLYVTGDAALRAWARGAGLNTDDRPYIEYATPASFFEHRQRAPAAVHALLVGFRPRAWTYPEPPGTARPIEQVLRAADHMHDAAFAKSQHNFEREYRQLVELIALAPDVRGVLDAITQVALRYRERHMTERSEALLSAVTARPDPPLRALVSLAELRRSEGRDAEAVALLGRALRRAPGQVEVRRALVELLVSGERWADAEPHLRWLAEAEPDDPYLRLDLAQALDRQGKSDEARGEVARVRAMPELEDRAAVWRHLERRGLGRYGDAGAPG
jgi:spermidine synthase